MSCIFFNNDFRKILKLQYTCIPVRPTPEQYSYGKGILNLSPFLVRRSGERARRNSTNRLSRQELRGLPNYVYVLWPPWLHEILLYEFPTISVSSFQLETVIKIVLSETFRIQISVYWWLKHIKIKYLKRMITVECWKWSQRAKRGRKVFFSSFSLLLVLRGRI